MRITCSCLAFSLLLCVSGLPSFQADASQAFLLAFGSCNEQTIPHFLWQRVLRNMPDVWIWSGDIIYANTEDMQVMRDKYAVLKSDPGYSTLASLVKVIGVWDDNDYGVNNGGKEYPQKDAAQGLLLDFLDEPADSPRRKQRGVYTSYVFGEDDQQVKVILLDTRYHRDLPSATGDMLGPAQWQWLEEELTHSTARVNILVSSTQVIPQDHKWEKWANFPASRQRLFSLIRSSQVSGLIIISGDRHIAEISKLDDPGLSYPVYEVTSSGLTHSWHDFTHEPNRHRIGQVFAEKNFGTIDIQWTSDPEVVLRVHDEENEIVLWEFLRLSQISP